jgi:peptide/nickel transport system substrate-binding protein
MVVVAALVLAACGSSGDVSEEQSVASTTADASSDTAGDASAPAGSGGTLRIGRTESFDGWVLDSAAAYATYQTHPAVFEPLTRFAADGAGVDPGLAESWSYDDATYTWTFVLRANAAFSNGDPVTSADVVFSYGIWSAGFNFGGSFAQVAGVEAVDERTVAFAMSAPDATLPALLSGSIAGVIPIDFAGMTEDEFYNAPIGAGPYMVTEWSSSGDVTLERNPHYYASDRPYFQTVEYVSVPDDNELARLFEVGDVDIVNYVSIAGAAQYPAGSLVVTPPSQVFHLSLNATRAPFDDAQVRSAVASSIEYASIAAGPLAGYGAVPTGVLPPNIGNWAAPSKPYYVTDVDAAQAAMAASTHADGSSVELIYDAANTTDALIAQIIQSDLVAVGIDVALTGLETLAFLDRAFTIDADMLIWSYGAISPDVSDPLGWIAGTGNLFTGADSTVLDAQRSTYLTTTDPAAKAVAITAIQDDAIDTAAAIALAETPTLHAASADLTGFAPAPWGLYYIDTIRSS